MSQALLSLQAKKPQTKTAIQELITKRFSARAFSDKTIDKDLIETIFEAASWAPSSMNEQPWHYLYAIKGTENFNKIWDCLLAGNKPWAKDAQVLIISLSRKTHEKDGANNKYSLYDTGAANAILLLQAAAMDIYGHEMGGFDIAKTRTTFDIDESYEIACIIALGYLDSHEKLEEPFKTREISPRNRKKTSQFVEKL